jgi:hypothetical protein
VKECEGEVGEGEEVRVRAEGEGRRDEGVGVRYVTFIRYDASMIRFDDGTRQRPQVLLGNTLI